MITLTDKAQKEVERLMDLEERNVYLRFSVYSGGCSGLTYQLAFVDTLISDHQIYTNNGFVYWSTTNLLDI